MSYMRVCATKIGVLSNLYVYVYIFSNNFSDHYQSLLSLQACFMDYSNHQEKQIDTDIYIYLYIVPSTMQSKGCFHETDLLDDRSCGADEKRPLTAGVGSCKAISQAGAQVMR